MTEHAASSTGRYAVKGKLGQGGMGAVYRATDLQTGHDVALKRLHLSKDAKRKGRYVEFFHQEFRTLAQLAHPNVVAVHDFGADEQGPYYTMELLEGDDLHALAPLPWLEICALMRDVCSAVALLHSRRLLHRDISPRNIRRTQQRRAKLIDFGGMAPMGPCKTVVGTPPLVPPEALLQQPLDARADLFAVGATLYYALTGKHAYRAHHIAQLNAAWATPPRPPSAHVPGIPAELDQLVLSLLSLEPLARPSSAAEVLDRLSAIAGLPRDEHLAVSRAYLATPELVARAEPLAWVRQRLASLHAGRGGALALEGAPGMGRSRMLDACVLEAKLASMAVLRANAADAATGSYGALRSLARQLGELHGSAKAAGLHSEALELLAMGGITPELDAARRPELQAAFQARLEAIARVQPVVIAIDDAERCDEPSLAALAVAAARASDRVLIALSCAPFEHGGTTGPLGIMMHQATRIALPPLGRADTEALLASVFGEVPYLQTLATRIHERAEGSPRGCMELSQYLLDHGLVRYQMGRWVLPSSLADAELPGTLSVVRREKLAALSANARELAEALALCEGTALDVEAFAELTAAGDRERVRSALDELLFAQVMRIESATYLFAAPIWQEELESCLEPADAQHACGRIADALARRGRDRLEVASYRLRAGQAAAAIDGLLEELALGSRWNRAPPEYDKLLRGAIDACHELCRPRRDRMILLRELIKVGQDLAAPDLHDHTLELLAELRRDSGLHDWQQLGGPSEPLARLQYVCERAQARNDTATAGERGFAQLEAIIALGVLASETYAIAARTGDASLLDLIPRFEPFYPLSPALKRIDAVTAPACRATIAGRYDEARALYQEQLADLLDPTTAGVPEDLRAWGIRALHYAIGNIEASLGREQALAHAAEIEGVPGWLVPAHSIRQVYHLTMGNLRQAERYRRQIELTRLQSPIKPPFAAAAVFQHVLVFSMADNPNGMRAAIPELAALGASHPGMRPFVPYARAEHARICGDYEEALALIERTRELVRPGEHPVWPWLVTSWLLTLLAQGRYDEAREIGLREIETANRVGLRATRGNIEMALALAEAKLGDFASACGRVERLIEQRMGRDTLGVALGGLHEARARIAIWMHDTPAFEAHAERCAQHFSKSGGEPALAAKYERLLQEARHHGLSTGREVPEIVASQTTVDRTMHTGSEDVLRVASSSLAECGSRQQRLQRAVELLADAASAQNAELFVPTPNGLILAASTAEGLSGRTLIPALSRMIDVGSGSSATAFTATLEIVGPSLPDGSPTQRWPLLLVQLREDGTAVAGIAVLYFGASAAVRLPTELGGVVAAALIEAGDVVPHMLGGSATTLHA
jgi:tetratricopeptide (TPR) repeat protein